MAEMSNLNRTVVRVLREAGVLLDLALEGAAGDDGQVVCLCSDGDQMVDAVVHQIRVASRDGKRVRPHTLALHGGAMVISGETGLYDEHCPDELLLTHIVQAEGPGLKGISTAQMCIHTPCGAAAMMGMSLVHQIWHLVTAVARVHKIDTNNELVPTLHVDYGEDPERAALATSDRMWVFRQMVDGFIAQAENNYGPALAATLLQLPFDTHRRRTYRIDLEAFVAFWHERGREIWGDLFDEDPCPPPRRATHSAPEVLTPARRVPMGTTSQGRQAGDGR